MNFDLLSCVVNCGTIPECTQLRGCLLDVYELEKEKLKQKIKEANVALMVDELGNDNGHCVIVELHARASRARGRSPIAK